MDGPPPPRDTGLRNIIDKLAEFVARNGPEFEQITKQKQQGNPKFDFLYGGEYCQYYQYRVATEQAFLSQQGPPHTAPPGPQHHQQILQNLHHGMHPQHQQQHQQNPHQMTYPPQGGHVHGHGHNLNQPHLQPTQQKPPNQSWNTSGNNSNGNATAANLTAQIESINVQQNVLRDQIRQSEQNLTAQHSALMLQQKSQIEDAIATAQNDSLHKQAEDTGINLEEFEAILQPIIDACTKDSISAGKNWILQHTSDPAKSNVVLQYLLKKALVNGSTFAQKLHLIYLVNDILHHCVRKNANDLKNALENVVIPMFCSADLLASDDQRAKLKKLLALWESKAKFFDACVISKLQSPDSSMQEYNTNLRNVHHAIVGQFTKSVKATLDNYQQQHQIFIQHATQQIAVLEQQKQVLEQQILANVLPAAASILPALGLSGMPQHPLQQTQQQPPPLMAQKIAKPSDSPTFDPTAMNPSSNSLMDNNRPHFLHQDNSNSSLDNHNPPMFAGGFAGQKMALGNNQNAYKNANIEYPNSAGNFPPQHNLFPAVGGNDGDFSTPPPNFFIPDLSKPPPGFLNPPGPSGSSNVVPEVEPKPTTAYYDLPAGLMVPLIRLEDYKYRPLNPEDIRLPPPTPQNERLTSALAAFYSLPSHDRPRDNEGWEKLGLYEYYKVKNAAKKQKEEEIKNGTREKSRSPSPVEIPVVKSKKSNKRCYRSKSRSRSKSPRGKSRSRSKSPQKIAAPRPRSKSPPPPERRSRYSSNRRSRSPVQRRSPIRDRDRDRDREREKDRDRGNMRRDRDRSTSPPPSFFGSNFNKPNEFIEETNKGHQMLMKMGWAGSGTGLGTKNQGIDAPISSGEVRDRKDMYKGIGVNLNDPFENFRKNKGAAFIHRMRSRETEKS